MSWHEEHPKYWDEEKQVVVEGIVRVLIKDFSTGADWVLTADGTTYIENPTRQTQNQRPPWRVELVLLGPSGINDGGISYGGHHLRSSS